MDEALGTATLEELLDELERRLPKMVLFAAREKPGDASQEQLLVEYRGGFYAGLGLSVAGLAWFRTGLRTEVEQVGDE